LTGCFSAYILTNSLWVDTHGFFFVLFKPPSFTRHLFLRPFSWHVWVPLPPLSPPKKDPGGVRHRPFFPPSFSFLGVPDYSGGWLYPRPLLSIHFSKIRQDYHFFYFYYFQYINIYYVVATLCSASLPLSPWRNVGRLDDVFGSARSPTLRTNPVWPKFFFLESETHLTPHTNKWPSAHL